MPFVPDQPTAGRFVPDGAPAPVAAKPVETPLGPEPAMLSAMDALASVGSQFAAGFPAYLAGGVAGLAAGDEDPRERASAASQQFTYQPRTKGGKTLADLINMPFEKLMEWAQQAGHATTDATDSPVLGALVESTVSMAPAALGFAPRGTRGKAAPAPEARATEAPRAEAPPSRPFPVEPIVKEPPKPIPAPRFVPDEPMKAQESPFPAEAGDLDAVLPLPKVSERSLTPEPLELTGETEGEIRAREAVEARTARESDRMAAAPAPEDFRLSGSDSVVDQARAAGQMELTEAAPPIEDLPPAKRVGQTEKQAAAMAKRRQINHEKDTLSTIMGKLGGIKADELLRDGMDTATLKDLRSTVVGLPAWRKNGGLSLDAMGEKLGELGFDVYDEAGRVDAYKVRELIEQEVSGSPVRTPEGYEWNERMAQEAREAEEAPQRAADQAALDEFGPGALGSNRFLDPALIGKVTRDVLTETLGQPGEHRNLFNPIRDAEQLGVARIERWAAAEGADIRQAFPKPADREALTMALVKGDLSSLTGPQRSVAEKLQQNYAAFWEYADNAGTSIGRRENYSPQVWDLADRKTRDILDAWRAERGEPAIDINGPLGRALRDAGTDPQQFSPFMLRRAIDNPIEGMALGLKPKSLDAADLFETYARSMATAVERGKALTALKELVFDDGVPAIVTREQNPGNYVKVDNPELEGLRIHEDIAPTVKVLMETNNPGVIATAIQTLAYTTKRALVSYSFFHPKALVEAYIGAGGNPLQVKGAIDAALKRYQEGGVGDVIDKGLEGGLKIGAPLEDVLGREKFKEILERTANALDTAGQPIRLPAGAPLRGLKALDEGLQRLTWNYIHTGLKLDTFMRKFETLRMKNPKASEKEIARQAAEFTNATFGGLNWERMIDSFDTPMARKVMSEVLSKQGRSVMQSVMFAPDWLISTFGSWTNALGTSERNALKRQVAQRYLATSAIATFSVGNALNYYFTGHSMFENEPSKKNPTAGDRLKAKMEVHLGDGRRMNIAKHFLEVPHAAVDPLQFAYNKMNPVVSEPIEQLANKQWLSSTWAPPITKKSDTPQSAVIKRGKHALEKFLPITGHQLMEQGPAGLGGFFGFPIYGLTEDQKRAKRAEGK